MFGIEDFQLESPKEIINTNQSNQDKKEKNQRKIM